MKDSDRYFYDLCMRIAEQSTCLHHKAGAIIAINERIASVGWNSPSGSIKPQQCPRCNKESTPSDEALENSVCTHAEVNAIGTCARLGITLDKPKVTLYSTIYPCTECAKLIAISGIKEVVYMVYYSAPLSRLILENSKIAVRRFLL